MDFPHGKGLILEHPTNYTFQPDLEIEKDLQEE
jgi:hypothetical protein